MCCVIIVVALDGVAALGLCYTEIRIVARLVVVGTQLLVIIVQIKPIIGELHGVTAIVMGSKKHAGLGRFRCFNILVVA